MRSSAVVRSDLKPMGHTMRFAHQFRRVAVAQYEPERPAAPSHSTAPLGARNRPRFDSLDWEMARFRGALIPADAEARVALGQVS